MTVRRSIDRDFAFVVSPAPSDEALDAGRYLLWAVPFVLFAMAAVAVVSGAVGLGIVLALAAPVLLVPVPRFGLLWWVVLAPYLRRTFEVSGVALHTAADVRSLYFSRHSPLRGLLLWSLFAWVLSIGLAYLVVVVLPTALS